MIIRKFPASRLCELKNAPFIFTKKVVIVVDYIGDLVVIDKRQNAVKTLNIKLREDSLLKDLGRPVPFLGIALTLVEAGVLLNQSNLSRNLRRDNKMTISKSDGPLMVVVPAHSITDSPLLSADCVSTFRNVVESLLYSAVKTRPDD